jgi:fluoride exporter
VSLVGIILVAAGGAIGSVWRYVLTTLVMRASGTLFPAGTFVVNVLGCVVFGAIAGAADQRLPLTPDLRLFLLVGLLGGFTTFSSYAFESMALMQQGQLLSALVNIVGQVVFGLVGLWVGYLFAR